MLYHALSDDAAPLGAASERAMRAARSACDEAPALDSALVTPTQGEVEQLISYVEMLIEMASIDLPLARGPPVGAR